MELNLLSRLTKTVNNKQHNLFSHAGCRRVARARKKRERDAGLLIPTILDQKSPNVSLP